MGLTKAIIDNINMSSANYIEIFLREQNLQRTSSEEGMDTRSWVNLLLQSGRLNEDTFERFLQEELFYGKRKQIRVYKLEDCRKYVYASDWTKGLERYSDGQSENFSNILGMQPNEEHPRKIVFASMKKNEQAELENIKILFACFIQVSIGRDKFEDSCSYIPVEIDFRRKRMTMKAWQRHNIAWEWYKTDALLDDILDILNKSFQIEVEAFGINHKKVLYAMSRNLINDAYLKIPAFGEVANLKETISNFSNDIIHTLPLKNKVLNGSGDESLQSGVMNFEAELRNVVESLTINDYFFQKDFSEIWDMGLEAIVARIRFNDKERVLTSLKGENTVTPIFVTKTFMTLRERMNESEMVDTIWIATDRDKGNLNLRYDSSNSEYLEIWVRYGIRFCGNDMNAALRIYDKYEQYTTSTIKESAPIAVSQ